MKPKFRNLIASFAPLSRTSLIVVASICAAGSSHADQTWTGASDALWSSTGNWSGGALPLPTENSVFNGGANLTIDTVASQNIGGISVTSPTGPVTINNNTLTLGSGGIDMSAATQNLTLGSAVTLANDLAQEWKVASGQLLTINGAVTGVTGVVRLNTTAGGTINVSSGTANNLLGRFATLNQADFAGLDASKNVVAGASLSGLGLVTYVANPVGTGANTANLGNGSYDVIDVVNSNLAGYPSAFRLGGTSINSGRGIRFNTAHATGADWVIDNSSSRNFAVQPGYGILVGSAVNTNVVWNGSGTIRTFGSGQHDLYITNHSANSLIFNCGFSVSSGRTWRMTKSGSGKVIFAGQADSVNGGLHIDKGTVQIGNGGATGTVNGTGSYTIASGATLDFNRTDTALSVANVIAGDGVVNQVGTGTVALTGTNTFSGGTNITAGAIAAASGANFGTGGITINGGGVQFAGVFDFTGHLVTIGSAGATFNTNGNAITLVNAFASGSTGSVTKTGAGSLTLTATNDYSGGTVVNAGTLLVNGSSSTGSGTVTVNSGSTIGGTGSATGLVDVKSGGILSPGAGIGTLTVGSLNLNAGSAATYEFNSSPSNDLVAVSGPLTINGGAITLTDVTGSPTNFTTPGTYNLISHTAATLGAGVASLSIANAQPGFTYTLNDTGSMITLTIGTTGVVAHWLTDASGSWIDGVNWSSNPTIPNGNANTAIFDKALTANATISLDGSKTVGALTFSSATFGYTIVPGSGGSITLSNGANPATIANNVGIHEITADIALTSNTLLSSGTVAESLTLSGIVSGSGTLTKPGPGSLSLLGNNTFNGLLTLTGGSTTFTSGALGLGNLTISGASLVWSGGNTQDISNRTIGFGSDPVTFDTNGNDVALVTGAIGNGGTATFTKAGVGRLTLGKDETFTGNVTISGGVLQLGTGGVTGSVIGAINNDAALDINLQNGSVFSNAISGSGSLTHSGSGSLSLNAANTFSGTTSITSGSLVLLNSLALQNSTLNYPTGAGTLSFNVLTAATLGGLSGDLNLGLVNVDTVPVPVALTVGGNNSSTTYNGILSGGGSLTKLGTGTLTLGGANNYTGATTVGAGILDLTYGATIVNTALTVNGTGKLQVSGGSFSSLTSTLAVSSQGLHVTDGTAAFAGTLFADGSSGSSNSAPIIVEGGMLTASSIVLGRTGANLTEAPANTNLYLTAGIVHVTGDLLVGTGSSQPNSTVVTRVDGGNLTVDGAAMVGLNNGGRMSILAVNGGEFISTGTAVNSGVVLGGPWAGQASLYVAGGDATAERIQLGQGAVGGSSLVRLTDGTLYVGSGGIVLGSSGALTTEIRLAGGVLAAKSDWNTSLPVNVSGPATVRASDSTLTAHNITLNGALTGVGSLTKSGDGTLTLTGGNSYTGNTEVSEGTLSVTTKSFNDASGILIFPGSGAHLNLNFSGGDRVATLEVDSVSMPDGIYGALGSGAQFETEAITGTGLLYVNTAVPLSPYESWAVTEGLTIGNNGSTQDPDNDGISNMLEFALGGDPLASDTGILPDLDASGANFVFTFNRAVDSVGDVALVFESGTDLSDWSNTIVIPATTSGSVTVSPGSPNDAITVTIPKGANTTLFGRLKAVK